MSPHHRHQPPADQPISANRGALLSTIVHLWPYIWPSERHDLKLRVLGAMVLLVLAKFATIAVPFTFKYATDALAGTASAPAAGWLTWVVAAPIAMTIAYGGMRMLMAALQQGRDAVFAKVAMYAVRRLAFRTFVHMHELSLRFHLERKTGGLTRVLERGRNAIETIVRMVILQLAPTIIEAALIAAVLTVHFDWRYVVVVVGAVALYLAWTYNATEWRIGIRRKMNDSDTDANVKAIDSLLNYETVKYFSAEEREAARYDRAMARYEDASVQSYISLNVLNAGQAIIYTVGLATAMVMCAYEVRAGTKTIGDFVLINAMMIQLYQPLNFMGMVYREIKQAVTDIENMFAISGPSARDRGRARRAPARGQQRHRQVRGRRFCLRSGAAHPEGHQLRGAGRQDGGRGRPFRRRQVDHLAAAVPLLRSLRRPHPDRRPGHRATSRRNRCARPSAWCRRTPCCSTTPSATTSATAAGKRPTPRWRRRRGWRRSTISSGWRPRATRPRSASAG